MRRLLVFLSMVLFSAVAYPQNAGKNFIDQNYIEVSGSAEMEVIPDEIHILITISEKDFKVKQSFVNYENELVAKLKELGIPVEKEFSVLEMNSWLKTSMIGRNEVFTAKQYLLIVHDAKTANKVFEEVEKYGITKMDVIKLDHSKIEQYRREVKINAIKAAKDKAEALSSAINQQIGRALYINEENVHLELYSNVVNFKKNDEMLDVSQSVGFRKIKLTYSVLVRFELK
jgi:uncharacterized protein